MAWHVREGRYGDVVLDDLSVVGLSTFTGNAWADPDVKVSLGMFINERPTMLSARRSKTIFGGQAGGWPAQFAQLISEVRGVEFVPVEFGLAGDLAWWSARIPGRVEARGKALTGPTTPPGRRVQLLNPAPSARWAPGPSPPRRSRSWTGRTASCSAGSGPGARAST